MKLTWCGHSCFLLETEQGSLVFDPYAPKSVPGLTLPKLTADTVFCSHGHHDHGYESGVKLSGRAPSFAVTRVPCFHDDCGGKKRGDNIITLVEAEGIRIAHLGDLGHELSDGQIAALGRVDVLLIPVGGFYTIDAVTAAKVSQSLGATVVVPMHYRGRGFGYDVIDSVEPFLALSKNVRRFDTRSIELTQPLEPMTAVLTLK